MNMPAKTQEEGLALLASLNGESLAGKYAAKLSFGQRCEILALSRTGCTRELLAKMYNVDRRTITHIYNINSIHYKNVREEELRLGRENFIAKYATLDVLNKAYELAVANKEGINNPNANKKRGIHNLQNDACEFPHRVVIQWVEADNDKIEISGWYYKDLDSEWP